MKQRSTLIILALVIAAGALLFGQTAAATLSEVITDPSGAVIADTAVQLVNLDTNVAQSTLSNQAGLYVFTSVPPGRYRISVKRVGFKESLKKSRVELFIEGYNMTNHVNCQMFSVNMNIISPAFLIRNSAGDARQFQWGARYEF